MKLSKRHIKQRDDRSHLALIKTNKEKTFDNFFQKLFIMMPVEAGTFVEALVDPFVEASVDPFVEALVGPFVEASVDPFVEALVGPLVEHSSWALVLQCHC